MKISVSILNAKDKKETIKILNNTDISYFHIDVMDGNFVKQISIPVEETLEISKVSEKKLDIHLMHSRPLSYRLLASSGLDFIVPVFSFDFSSQIR